MDNKLVPTTTTAMDKSEFEKRFLALIYQTDVVITAPNVAYHLSIPIEEAQEQLIALELNGTIQQRTDPQGNSYYMMPNRPPPGTLPAGLGGGAQPNAPAQSGFYNPTNQPSVGVYVNPGAKGRNINGLVLNVIFPGVGSLVCGKMIGLAMLGLVLLGFVMFFLPLGFGRLAGLLPIVIGWLWSIIGGVSLLNEREPGPGIPG